MPADHHLDGSQVQTKEKLAFQKVLAKFRDALLRLQLVGFVEILKLFGFSGWLDHLHAGSERGLKELKNVVRIQKFAFY